MKRIVTSILFLSLAAPSFATTHKDVFNVPCNELWRALKDTLKNSGKYGIIGLNDSEMTASYNIGGNLTGKRVNSAVLNSKDNGASCELQVQTAFSGLVNNDAGDLKSRVTDSLIKLKGQPLPIPASPSDQSGPQTAPAQAMLAIDSTPPNADIEIDGAFVGNTPSAVSVALGSHNIAVKKKGFADWTRTLNVTGGNVHLNAELEAAAPSAPAAPPQ
jgi:hypothetical protein